MPRGRGVTDEQLVSAFAAIRGTDRGAVDGG